MKHLKKYFPFSKAIFQSYYLSYRISLCVWLLSDYIILIAQYYLWYAIFNNATTPILHGYTFEMMIFYVLATKIVGFMMQAEILGEIGDDIKQGTIAIQLIKPISYRMQLLFKYFGGAVGNLLFFAMPTMAILLLFAAINQMQSSLLSLLLFLISLMVSYTLNFLISFIFANLIFYTTNYFGIYQLKNIIFLLFSGALLPINFYPESLQKIIALLPFKYIIYVPVSILMGQSDAMQSLKFILLQLGWVLIAILISNLIWKKSTRKLVIHGG